MLLILLVPSSTPLAGLREERIQNYRDRTRRASHRRSLSFLQGNGIRRGFYRKDMWYIT